MQILNPGLTYYFYLLSFNVVYLEHTVRHLIC
jgi:hypothetical protein